MSLGNRKKYQTLNQGTIIYTGMFFECLSSEKVNTTWPNLLTPKQEFPQSSMEKKIWETLNKRTNTFISVFLHFDVNILLKKHRVCLKMSVNSHLVHPF
jgi:hypothetical protein